MVSTASRCLSRTARRYACGSSASLGTRCRNTSTRSNWSTVLPMSAAAAAAIGKTMATTGMAGSDGPRLRAEHDLAAAELQAVEERLDSDNRRLTGRNDDRNLVYVLRDEAR